ncbi:Gnk2-homologous domain [Sesbania bispinosa]|nr:Gnk2-homologous domain [Sesbania bispinosa]
MGFPRKSLFLILFLVLFTNLGPSLSAPDYTTLVYKGCSKETFTDPNGMYSQALSALFGSLVSQSTKGKFFKTTSGSGQTSITGLFQCRGDLSNSDCYNCVSKLPVLSDKLCGKTIAARVQLLGCYMLYEVAGFAQISGMQILYKTCGATNAAGSGFEERRDTAFSVMENGVDCGDCVKFAVQRAQVECGALFQVKSICTRQNPGKTVAIILGGAAGGGFFDYMLAIC